MWGFPGGASTRLKMTVPGAARRWSHGFQSGTEILVAFAGEVEDLHDAHHPRVRPVADDADRHLAPRQIALDEHRLAEGPNQLRAGVFQVFAALYPGALGHPLGAPLRRGLDEKRRLEGHGVRLLRPLHHGEGRGGYAAVAHQALGERLVQGDGAGQRVREGVGLLEQLADGGHLRLPRAPAHPLGEVEHEVPAAAGGEELRELDAPADPLDRVAMPAESLRERGHGLFLVELQDLLGREPRGQVVRLQVVAESEAKRPHRHRSAGSA
jgi:hypothetical protein